jgi:hypothetical protein
MNEDDLQRFRANRNLQCVFGPSLPFLARNAGF